ncbi:sigma-70 family RNA polymerase sigma factor [Rhodanobacter sp. DHB23]|uniref:RNA polymerase sigma factor n=1 Tax=Rhodanobacter sp. DHB23 TaxID=2775923 RepID=UPI0017842624|nr:sigma-70 family RNA polymerase sigma factor [Rhodanobacter sp. DHB23]MBD8872641.1 sigma-70 family RNA polymerase sigma factor [Rhodanobacter sp. DHB23]
MREGEFAALLHGHAGLLSRIAASYEADPSLRDDLLQDIALALWKALPAWRGEAALKTFVARVAHNRGASHVIGRTRRPAAQGLDDDLADPAHGPESHAQLEQKRLRLQDAVRALPLTLRQAVTLALEGFSQQEIALALGISANNVAVRLNRARKALKDALGESA